MNKEIFNNRKPAKPENWRILKMSQNNQKKNWIFNPNTWRIVAVILKELAKESKVHFKPKLNPSL